MVVCIGLYIANTMAVVTEVLGMPEILTPTDAIKGTGSTKGWH